MHTDQASKSTSHISFDHDQEICMLIFTTAFAFVLKARISLKCFIVRSEKSRVVLQYLLCIESNLMLQVKVCCIKQELMRNLMTEAVDDLVGSNRFPILIVFFSFTLIYFRFCFEAFSLADTVR